MSNLPGLQKPYKVWSADRTKRKSITAATLNEFRLKGATKLGYDRFKRLRVVLETDGTDVEDDLYFESAPSDTIFLLLRDNETWLPPGMDALKSALSAIPQIVCDTMDSMKLRNKTPTWSIRDEHGVITVTLQWQHSAQVSYLDHFDESACKFSTLSTHVPALPTGSPYAQLDKVYSSTFPRHSSSRSYLTSAASASRNISTAYHAYRSGAQLDAPPPFKALSADHFSFIDPNQDLSSVADLTSYCDFHCSSLHREGGSIKVSNRSVATSPMPDPTISPVVITLSPTTSPFESGSLHAQVQATDEMAPASQHTPAKAKKGPVRFMDLEKQNTKPNISRCNLSNGQVDSSSDESETQTTEREEEQLSQKSLLLIDQLSIDQKRHLSIKDIGIILERLSSKIVDIDKLERDKESSECYNWLIKGTIKGDVLREIGVVYNGQYYGIMEHPGYY